MTGHLDVTGNPARISRKSPDFEATALPDEDWTGESLIRGVSGEYGEKKLCQLKGPAGRHVEEKDNEALQVVMSHMKVGVFMGASEINQEANMTTKTVAELLKLQFKLGKVIRGKESGRYLYALPEENA